MRRNILILLITVAVLVGGAFSVGFLLSLVSGKELKVGSLFGGKVGLVEVEGQILISDLIVEELERARRDDSIKGVLMRINSPGGSVAASQEILEAVRLVTESKPVVVSMGSLAASGGYYISCGATKILANPGTITGSIGVKLQHLEIGELLKLVGVGHETLKSGRHKELIPIDRPIGEEERKILLQMLEEIHDQFKEHIAEYRNLDRAKVDALADGRIFTGREALELGLVDQIGGLSEAIKLVGGISGIAGEPKLVPLRKRSGWIAEKLFGDIKGALQEAISSVETTQVPLLMYR